MLEDGRGMGRWTLAESLRGARVRSGQSRDGGESRSKATTERDNGIWTQRGDRTGKPGATRGRKATGLPE